MEANSDDDEKDDEDVPGDHTHFIDHTQLTNHTNNYSRTKEILCGRRHSWKREQQVKYLSI